MIHRLLVCALALGSFTIAAPAAHATELGAVVATISVGSTPWGIAISPDGTSAYVANKASNSISVISTATRSVTQTVTGVANPQGLAVTPAGTQLYSTATGGFTVVDLSSFAATWLDASAIPQVSGTVSCTGSPALVANPAGGAVYAACGGNGSTVDGVTINTATQAITMLANVSWPLTSVAIAPSGIGLIWANENDGVWFQQSGEDVAVGANPYAVAVVPGIARANVTVPGTGTLAILSTTHPAAVLATVTMGGAPHGLAVTSDGRTAYVADSSSNRIVVVDLVSLTVLGAITVGTSPEQVALTPDGNFAYVTNAGSNTVSVVALHSVAASGANVPTAAMQQFARTEAQTCDTAPADLADFPALGTAVRNDAWGASWAQWPNGGTGGFVCSRQPYYTSAGTWALR